MKNQSTLNWIYGTGITLVALGIIFSGLKINPFEFFGNLFVYLILAVIVVVLLPGILSFALRYWPIQKMDDNYGKKDDHLPGIFHLMSALVLGYAFGLAWSSFVVRWCSMAPALNTWAWDLIRFQSPNQEMYEVSSAWFWIPLLISVIGYWIADFSKN